MNTRNSHTAPLAVRILTVFLTILFVMVRMLAAWHTHKSEAFSQSHDSFRSTAIDSQALPTEHHETPRHAPSDAGDCPLCQLLAQSVLAITLLLFAFALAAESRVQTILPRITPDHSPLLCLAGRAPPRFA